MMMRYKRWTVSLLQYKSALLVFALLLWGIPAAAQVEVNGSVAIEQAVDAFAGRGIKTRNVRYSGAPQALGTYRHDGDYPAFQEGIILSTGRALDFAGPNDRPKVSSLNGMPGDRDLDHMAGTRTFDMAAIDFDFMADRDSVSFSFFFASEEYNEFVGSTFNDVFAIVVTGPGLGNGQNLAYVPGTKQPIHINSVSIHDNRGYYWDNNPFKLNGSLDDGLKAKLNPELYKNCQFDGMTRPISVGLRVKPMTKYHLKVIIADAGDGANDSAVLLQGGSFQSEEQYWRVQRRVAIRAQAVADSIARADSLAAVFAAIEAARLDSIRQDSLLRVEAESRDEVLPVAPEGRPLDSMPVRPAGVSEEPKSVVAAAPSAGKPAVPVAGGASYKSPPDPSSVEVKLLFEYVGDEYFVEESDDPLVDALGGYLGDHPDKKVGLFTPDGSQNADLRYDIIRTDLIKAGIDPGRIFRNGFSFLNGAEAGQFSSERLEIWVR